MEMAFEEFIKNHIRVAPKGEHIQLTSAQHAFLGWLENCKKKGLKPFHLKCRNGRI